MTTTKNIYRTQGDTYPIECLILTAVGTAYDLTGVLEVKMGISPKRSLSGTETPLFEIEGNVINPPTGGIVEFPVTSIEAANAIGTYYGEIQFITSDGYIVTTEQFEYHIKGQIILSVGTFS